MSNAIEYLQQNREKLKLVGYFALILVLAQPLSQMLGKAWAGASLSREIIQLRLLVGLGHQAISISMLGLFLGFLILMTIDPKKRWQAALLWLGTGLGLVALQAQGLLLGSPNVDLATQFPFLIVGCALGFLIGGGRSLVEIQTAKALEFRRAAKALYLMLAIFTVIGLLELHVQYPPLLDVSSNGVSMGQVSTQGIGFISDGLATDVAVSGLFIVTLRRFVQYDAEKKFFILGPRASGKSLFLIGAYLEALGQSRNDKSDTPLNPSEDLMSMLEALDRRESEWIVEATGRGELKQLQFQFVHGSVFPTNIQLSAMDYAGEYLDRLPDALTGAIPEEDMDTTLIRLAEGVRDADTLMLVVDTERFINNEPLDISEYFSILQTSDNKDVVIVATKTDVLANKFEEERGLEAHLYYDEFTEFVNTRLRQSENIDSLITETAGTTIHPVYYQTKVNENGNRVPMRDDSGSVMTVGFDELLEKIGRI